MKNVYENITKTNIHGNNCLKLFPRKHFILKKYIMLHLEHHYFFNSFPSKNSQFPKKLYSDKKTSNFFCEEKNYGFDIIIRF